MKIKTIRVTEIYVNSIEINMPKDVIEIIDIKIHSTGNEKYPLGITYLYN